MMLDSISLLIIGLLVLCLLSVSGALLLWWARPVTNAPSEQRAMRHNDVRLPLVQNAIHDMAKLIENLQFRLAEMEILPDDAEAKWRELFERVNEDVKGVADYTLDLKLLWQLNGANPPLRRERVDLCALSEEVIAHLAPTAKQTQVRLIAQSQSQIPPAYVDRHQMKRVLINLVDNAIQYCNNQNDPRVVITLRADNVRLLIEVSDNGAGIPPENLQKLWEESFKLRDARTIDIAGSGLGTVIVRQVVAQHGGQVEVTSRPGLTKFTVVLPVVTQATPAQFTMNPLHKRR